MDAAFFTNPSNRSTSQVQCQAFGTTGISFEKEDE